MKKHSDIITAQDSSELSLDDLQSQVCSLAQADTRFNNKPAGNSNNCCGIYCCSLLTDGDSFKAVISAADGKYYEVSLTIEDGKVSSLGSDATVVSRKTMWVTAAKDGAYYFDGELVKAGGPGSGPHKGGGNTPPYASDESESGKNATEKTNDAASASMKAYESGSKEDHQAAMKSHEAAAEAHNAAAISSQKPSMAKIHSNQAEAHMAAADAHSFTAKTGHLGVYDSKSGARIGSGPKASDKGFDSSTKTLRASGTPPGALSGHATKKSELAASASQEAHEASATAHESGDDADHNAAKDAHEAASSAHQAAMLAAAKANDPEAATDHAKAMAAHDACADGHCRQDEDVIEASLKSLGFTIKEKSESKDIIHCRANAAKITPSKPWALNEPVSFMYMPGGISTITAGFRDKAINITVDVDEDAAKTVQASYENLRANLPKQQPFGCIEHREEEASVRASGDSVFAWGEYDGDEGILITAEPTKLGADNVNGKVHRSWSPSFATDADYAKAKLVGGVYSFPEGVRGSTSNPARITGIDFCFGTLTNKPAFRNMPPVKAKLGVAGEKPEPVTVETIFARLAEPSAVDIVFSKLRRQSIGEPVKSVTAEDVFSRLAGKKIRAASEQPDADKKANIAHEASQVAHEASVSANNSDAESDHADAAKLHEKASKAHAVAMIANKKDGNDDAAEAHADAMKAHDSMAEAHGDCDNDSVSAKIKTIEEIVKGKAKPPTISSETILARLSRTASPQAV